MRIVYVARRPVKQSNDDEGAVQWALEQLGHSVRRIDESQPFPLAEIDSENTDLVLFNKWNDLGTLQKLGWKRVRRAFWYWDLVEFSADPALVRRSILRREWMKYTLPHTDLGFCTDGDWVVNSEFRNKLIWLPQGADERVCLVPPPDVTKTLDVTFTGSAGPLHSHREGFVRELAELYGTRFCHVTDGLHGRDLQELYACAKIVVAPDTPITSRYWSNRLYNVIGMGGFLLHPKCGQWGEPLRSEHHYWVYESRNHLHALIEILLNPRYDRFRANVARDGREFVLKHHTYRDRCRELIRCVEELL